MCSLVSLRELFTTCLCVYVCLCVCVFEKDSVCVNVRANHWSDIHCKTT